MSEFRQNKTSEVFQNSEVKSTNSFRSPLFILFYFALILFLSCESNTKSEAKFELTGAVSAFSGCKYLNKTTGLSKNIETLPDTLAAVEYFYDGESQLILTHINAGFNCCPAEIVSTFVLEGNTIIITPKETASDCDCNCLYDLVFDLTNVQAQLYTIRFVEQYTGEEDEKLEFEVDFSKQPTGSYCVPRTHYPWGF